MPARAAEPSRAQPAGVVAPQFGRSCMTRSRSPTALASRSSAWGPVAVPPQRQRHRLVLNLVYSQIWHEVDERQCKATMRPSPSFACMLYVASTGRAMLLCPAHTKTSPKRTWGDNSRSAIRGADDR